jgi:hypothetical protein
LNEIAGFPDICLRADTANPDLTGHELYNSNGSYLKNNRAPSRPRVAEKISARIERGRPLGAREGSETFLARGSWVARCVVARSHPPGHIETFEAEPRLAACTVGKRECREPAASTIPICRPCDLRAANRENHRGVLPEVSELSEASG